MLHKLKLLILVFSTSIMFTSTKLEAQGSSTDPLNDLKEGNLRFIEGKTIHKHYLKEVAITKSDQHPKAFILSCIDSRVPDEIIFDQGFGDLFVARVAGNVEDKFMLGSMEYATVAKGTKLIVVMGHKNCGAVKGAIDNVQLGNLTDLLKHIEPSINKNETNKEKQLDEAIKTNVKNTIKDILERSPTIKEKVEKNQVKIIGAYYDLSTGKVSFL